MCPSVLVALAVLAQGIPTDLAWSGVVVGPDGRPAAGAEVAAAAGVGIGPSPPAAVRTDDQGRFRVEAGPDGGATLWAFRPGLRAARRAVPPGGSPAPIRLALAPAGDAVVTVAGPDGRPVAGARVVPVRVRGTPGSDRVPPALADRLAATTDRDGRAAIPGLLAVDLIGVRVVADGFGSQQHTFAGAEPPAPEPRAVGLRPTGRIAGRLTAEDPAEAAGQVVRASTAPSPGEPADAPLTEVEATTDAEGRFQLAGVAAGRVSIRVCPRAGSPILPARVARRNLEPGQSLSVEIPLRRGVRVHGVVRDAAGAGPVPGAVIALLPAAPFEPDPVRTDAAGHFEAYVPPGPLSYRVVHVPAPFLGPPAFLATRPVEVPAGIAGFAIPDIAVTRGVEVAGAVVDAAGRPAPGARVVASWTFFDGRIRAPRSASALCDDAGRFRAGPVDPAAELSLVARSGPDSSEVTPARAGDPAPVRLALRPAATRALDGRVVDRDGRPIPGASVRAWFVPRPGDEAEWAEASADEAGRYRIAGLPADARLHAVACAPGFLPGRARPVEPGAGGATLPDLALAVESARVAVAGRVVDAAGRPVAGVAVSTWGDVACPIRARTDDAGRFRLDDAVAGPGFLFAAHPEYRFSGRAIDAGSPGAAMIEVRLTRLDEPTPPPAAEASRPPAAADLARSILEPLVKLALEPGRGAGDAAGRVRVLEALAGVDPAGALGLLDGGKVADLWLADPIRAAAARGLAATDPARAAQAVDAILDAETRTLGRLDALAAVPAGRRADRRAWLEAARADADAIRDPARRASALGRVAAGWLDLDDPDRAARVFAAARPLVDPLPGVARGARARGELAEHLARVDPAAALALLDGVIDPIAFDHHRLGVARVLADRDPAGVGRIVATTRDGRSLAADLPALCHAVARFDPALARGWLDRLGPGSDPCLAPFSLGLMALAVAGSDRPAATGWLREAFGRLEAAAASAPGGGERAWPRDPAEVAAGLIAVAARVDPGLVPEFAWRALAIRGPRRAADPEADAALIVALAPRARAGAEALFAPLAARARSGRVEDPRPVVVAAAALDPDLARLLLAELAGGEPGDALRRPRAEARLALAESLAATAAAADPEATLAGLLRAWAGRGAVEP